MDVVLDDNIVQFIKGKLPHPPEEETFSLEELQRSSQNVHWQKPNYEEIGCMILDTYFSQSTDVACYEGCNKKISSDTTVSGGGCLMSKQFSCKCEISKAKNQLVQDMRSMKVRLTKLDERTIFDKKLTEKGLKLRDGRSFGLQNAQDISTDCTYETIQKPGQEQVSFKTVLSIQLTDCGSNDFDNQHPNDCSIPFLKHLTPSEDLLTNSMRVTRSRSREKKAEPPLVSSSALSEQLITKKTTSMTNSGATASPSLNAVGLANNKRRKASKSEALNKILASSSQPSRSRTKKLYASKTKNMKCGKSLIHHNYDSTISENFLNCTVSLEDCMLPTSKKFQGRDILPNKDLGTFCKHSSVTSQSSAAVAEDPSLRQDLSEADCETSRYGRTIKKVKLTNYDATPDYITALQQMPASLRLGNGQSGENLNKASYGPMGSTTDQQPQRVRVGKDSNAGNDSGSDESDWPGKDVDSTHKQKKYTRKLNLTKHSKKASLRLGNGQSGKNLNKASYDPMGSTTDQQPQQVRVGKASNAGNDSGSDETYWPGKHVDSTHKQKKYIRKWNLPKHIKKPSLRIAKLKNGRTPVKKSDYEDGEDFGSSSPSTNKNYGCSIHHTAESSERKKLEEHVSKHGVASKTKQKLFTVEKKHVEKAKNKTIRTKKSDLENVFSLSKIASPMKKKKLCKAKGTEPQDLQRDTEPCKVMAKKGTLTHLKQRQKRQEYLLQQLQEDEAFDDFFDDMDDPQIGNFHKSKYQINSQFLNSPVTGDSTAVTSFNSSCGSFFQTPTTKNGKKSNGKMQTGILSTAPCNIGAGFTPRSALLARFAGDEIDGRGWMVNTPTTAGKGGDFGVNLGLAVTPGELLERSVANHIIYNNKMKRPPKRLSATNATALKQSIVGLANSGGSSQSGGCNALSISLFDGSLGQSPNTSARAGRLPEVAVEYEYSPAGPKKLKRLKLPSILDNVASQEEEGSDHDDYFEDGDH